MLLLFTLNFLNLFGYFVCLFMVLDRDSVPKSRASCSRIVIEVVILFSLICNAKFLYMYGSLSGLNFISWIDLSTPLRILSYLNYYSFIKILDYCFFYLCIVMTILDLFVPPYKFLNHVSKLYMGANTHTNTYTC